MWADDRPSDETLEVTKVSATSTRAPTLSAAPALRSLGWVMRRALFGLTLLVTLAFAGAWLLHASIDPAIEAAQGTADE